MTALPLEAEWIETDGLGGFASGTVSGVRSRRYHALLMPALTPPTGRMALVNAVEAWLDVDGKSFALSSHRYAPDVIHPDGVKRLVAFSAHPWPTWTYAIEEHGSRIEFSILVPRGERKVVLRWRGVGLPAGARLRVLPMLSGRDYHHAHHENASFRFDAEQSSGRVVWRPYEGLPAIEAWHNGEYEHKPMWFRNFLYEWERSRGLDFLEDLASPGEFTFEMDGGEAVLVFCAGVRAEDSAPDGRGTHDAASERRATQVRVTQEIQQRERTRREGFATVIDRAAEAYLVRRGDGLSIVAGYPWFTDWGRDTFIALRGLCLATGRLDEAKRILLQWSGSVSRGMLPNRFPDSGEQPEYNSVDASLWYVIAVGDLLRTASEAGVPVASRDRDAMSGTISQIVSGYAAGTRHGIRLDEDGLLAAGEPGVQLTWMDAKYGDWVVTPRIGKPVEIQALWINALHIADELVGGWAKVAAKGARRFRERFVDDRTGRLADVVDVDHVPGTADWSMRPNQVFAAGGLPVSLLPQRAARRVIDEVERCLVTPAGLRSLAADDPRYVPRYEGGIAQRDGAYHQGTVWAWLMGPFVEAWVKSRGGKPSAIAEARRRFLDPLMKYALGPGFGHVPEIADGDPPHAWKGCPFQAWSVGELLRMDRVILRGAANKRGSSVATSSPSVTSSPTVVRSPKVRNGAELGQQRQSTHKPRL